MALVTSVSSHKNLLTFTWDNGDCITFNLTISIYELVSVSERSTGIFMDVKIHGIQLYSFRFDSKKSALGAHDVVVGKKAEWSKDEDAKEADAVASAPAEPATDEAEPATNEAELRVLRALNHMS